MKWRRLAGVSPWCSLVTVRVMPCGRENTNYTQFVHWLAANVVLAEHNWCGHVTWGRAPLVLPHTHRTRCNGARVEQRCYEAWVAATLNNLMHHSFLYTLYNCNIVFWWNWSVFNVLSKTCHSTEIFGRTSVLVRPRRPKLRLWPNIIRACLVHL